MIDANGLSVRLSRAEILRSLTFQLGTGVAGLLGPNGAGKTTLMRTLATVIAPSAGELSINGWSVRAGAPALRTIRGQVGFAPQTPIMLSHLRVDEQVGYAAWLKGVDSWRASGLVSASLEDVGLTRYARSRTRSLSGGMLRRLGIAMAIVAQPSLILFDEPTAGLDAEHRSSFLDLATRLGTRSTVLISTHLIEDVVTVCDNVLVLANGEKVLSGPISLLSAQSPASVGGAAAYLAGYAKVTGMSA